GTNLANGGSINGAATSTLVLSNVQAAQAGSYSIFASNALGSVTSSNALLTVLAPPAITSQPGSQTVAEGVTMTLNAAAAGSGPLSYQWRFNGTNLANGGSISGATGPSLTITSVRPTHTGNYS